MYQTISVNDNARNNLVNPRSMGPRCFALDDVGTSLASAGEAHFNATGLLIMFCAETCEATRLVLTQKLLTNLKFPARDGRLRCAPRRMAEVSGGAPGH